MANELSKYIHVEVSDNFHCRWRGYNICIIGFICKKFVFQKCVRGCLGQDEERW
jgi:hypothetical protein